MRKPTPFQRRLKSLGKTPTSIAIETRGGVSYSMVYRAGFGVVPTKYPLQMQALAGAMGLSVEACRSLIERSASRRMAKAS